MAQSIAILSKCDAIYRIPGESKGADLEVEYAKEHGIPIITLKDLGIDEG